MLENLRSSIASWLSPPTKAAGQEMSPEASSMLSGMSVGRVPPRRGTEELLRAYREIPALRAIVQRIAESFAAVEWTVHRTVGKGGKSTRSHKLQRATFPHQHKALEKLVQSDQAEELPDDPVLDLLDAGNDCMDGFAVRQVMASHMELKGEAFAWLERNPVGMPVRMWPLPPHWVRDIPVPGKPTFIIAIAGREKEVLAEDVFFVRDPDPHNPYDRGTGIGESLGDELDTSEYISLFMKSFFYNDATPSVVVAFPAAENMSGDSLEGLEVDWGEKHRGARRARAAHFMNRKPDITIFDQSFKDMNLVELQKFLRAVLRETWGMPPEIMGLIENSNRATIEAAGYIFARWLLVPRLERWRIALQTQVVPQFDERKVVGYVSPVPEDKTHILEVAKSNTAARTRNEWRELQGLHDRGPEDDVYLQPLTAVEVEAPTPPPPSRKMLAESYRTNAD